MLHKILDETLRMPCDGRNDPATTPSFPSLALFISAASCSLLVAYTIVWCLPYLRVSAIRPLALPFHLARSHWFLFATGTGSCTDVRTGVKLEILFDPVAALIYLHRYVDSAHTKRSVCERDDNAEREILTYINDLWLYFGQ